MKGQKINFIVGNISFIGGVEKVTQVLSHAFINNSAEVFIHSIYSKNTSCIADQRVKVLHYDLQLPDNEKNILGKIKRLLLNGLILRKKLCTHSGFVIFQGFYMACYLPFLNILKNKRIVCEHNTYNAPGIMSRAFRIFIYKLWNPHLVVLTDFDRDRYQALGIKKISKIYNPSPFPILEAFKDRNEKNFISLGRFTFQKRFDLMIDLCAASLKKHKEWKLIIQGEGEDLEKMKLSILKKELLSQITILPAGPPEQLYQKGAIFLMTSLFEGLPMTLIESMSFGIPVICFNCSPGIAEIVKNGVNGYLIENGDDTSFIDKLNELLENPSRRMQMGENAKLTAQKFSVSDVLSSWEKILK